MCNFKDFSLVCNDKKKELKKVLLFHMQGHELINSRGLPVPFLLDLKLVTWHFHIFRIESSSAVAMCQIPNGYDVEENYSVGGPTF